MSFSKKLFLILLLFSAALSLSHSDVTLTDQEYDQIMEALNNSETQLTQQENETTILNKTIESLSSQLSSQNLILSNYNNLLTTSQTITNQQATLYEPLKISFEQQKSDLQNEYWTGFLTGLGTGAAIGTAAGYVIGFKIGISVNIKL